MHEFENQILFNKDEGGGASPSDAFDLENVGDSGWKSETTTENTSGNDSPESIALMHDFHTKLALAILSSEQSQQESQQEPENLVSKGPKESDSEIGNTESQLRIIEIYARSLRG